MRMSGPVCWCAGCWQREVSRCCGAPWTSQAVSLHVADQYTANTDQLHSGTTVMWRGDSQREVWSYNWQNYSLLGQLKQWNIKIAETKWTITSYREHSSKQTQYKSYLLDRELWKLSPVSLSSQFRLIVTAAAAEWRRVFVIVHILLSAVQCRCRNTWSSQSAAVTR